MYTSNADTRWDLKMLKENITFMWEQPEEELNFGWSIRKRREGKGQEGKGI